jgi:hypothetical protein
MTLILTLISTFLPLLSGLIGSKNDNLAQTGLTALGALLAAWGKGKTDDASAALEALAAVTAALKADTSLDPAVLAQVQEAEALASAAVTAVEGVETGGYNLATYVVPPAVS